MSFAKPCGYWVLMCPVECSDTHRSVGLGFKSQKTEVRSQKTEDRRQKIEDQ